MTGRTVIRLARLLAVGRAHRRPAFGGLAFAGLAAAGFAVASASAQPSGGETGGLPQRPAGAGFAIDSQGRLLVVDHLRGFLIGRFQPTAGIDFGMPPAGGGVPLEAPGAFGPELPAVPLTTLNLQSGFPFMTSSTIAASPCVADLEGDGLMELVVASSDGTVDLLRADGRPLVGWPVHLEADCFAPPAAGDVDADGRLEIALADGSGRLRLMRASGLPAAGWPVALSAGSTPAQAIFAAPAMGDLDGDGADEICVADAAGTVWVLDGEGRVLPGWPRPTASASSAAAAGVPAAVLASPALADLDGRPGLEIVTGSHSGEIHAWDIAGQALPGWPVTLPGRPRAGFGDPAVGDVNADGRPEIVVAAEAAGEHAAAVFALDGSGRFLPGWPVALDEACNAGAALGDLDGDGADDIVVATLGGNAALVALDGRSAAPLPGWPVHFSNQTVNAVPLIADLDGDGNLDVLVATLATGAETHAWLWAADRTGRELRSFPVFLPYDEIVRAAPAVADLDSDGDLELVCGTEVLNSVYAWDLEALCEPDLLPWPGQAGGPARNGRVAGRGRAGSLAAAAPPGAPLLDGGISLDGSMRLEGTPLGSADETGAGEAGLTMGDSAGALTTISFELDAERAVRLVVFDIQGTPVRRLLDHRLPPGRYAIYWDGKDDAGRARQSGIYFYQLGLGNRSTTRQLMLLK